MDNNPNRSNNRPPRLSSSLTFYAALLLILIFLASYLANNGVIGGTRDKKTLADVMSYIEDEDNKIDNVQVNGTNIVVEYEDAQGDTHIINQSVPYEYVDDLINKLDDAKVRGRIKDYDYKEPFDWSIIINLTFGIGSIVLLVVLLMNFSKQAKDGGGVFSFGSNKARLTNPNDMKVKFDDVAGSLEEKEELSEIVDFLKSPKKYAALGAKIPKGVLLHGAPGTGKTLLARAVAGEAGVPFFYISGSDFVEMLVGAGAARVRSLFADAKKAAPCVIFIDEIDAVGRKRGAGLGGGNDEREQTLNQILVEMDGFDTNTNIIVLAATNRVDVLDPALLRPGRFDRRVMVNEPDVDEREAILGIHAKNKPLAKDVSLREIALSTAGFTGADLANLLNEAALLSARRNKKEITPLEISDATFRVMMGPEKNSKKLTDKAKRLTSYHEAGHAVILRAVADYQKVDRVTIIPAGRAGGFTAYKPKEDLDYYTEKMLLDSIMVSLGGRAAEEIFLGEISTGAASDLQHCNRVASAMIKKYGLSPKFRNMVFGDENDEVFVGASFGQVQPYSDETAAEIDKEIQRIIDECYEKTKQVLIEKKNVMEGLATRLMDVLKVDGPEFEEIYEKDGDLTDIIARDPHKNEEAKADDKPSEAPVAEEKSEEKKADEWSIDSAISEAVAKEETKTPDDPEAPAE
ncbi:MAG: ATP-dependent zinc metalloprotease FtsH [Saccharofermentans sp.]|nr:ATP-dependent zinc metalloprotease FtsH [Saccharofermentans sp.]